MPGSGGVDRGARRTGGAALARREGLVVGSGGAGGGAEDKWEGAEGRGGLESRDSPAIGTPTRFSVTLKFCSGKNLISVESNENCGVWRGCSIFFH